ncbi:MULTISPECIES: DNA-processing protein DprA [Enorma]|uniref:DNA-processing protein DprA n=1 Tax=Enorma TaxID=1472762 RepID=UPI00034C5044|nr:MULTISPECIES: DNA-processing protein DprA [Enorma]
MDARNQDARWELVPGDALYPPALLDLLDPPERLYVRGDPEALAAPGLAIVGTRRMTPYGAAVTELAARIAVASGLTVISGGALGCDQCAGWEALHQGGRHVIVLGCGADVVYPRTSAALIEQALATGGAVVSLVPWGCDPRPYLFPRRNRVIAALARAVFVGEAGMPSGTFSTAEAADAIGREVLAVPGSIFSPNSRGSNYLIATGACCISDEEALEVAISRIFGTLRFSHGQATGPVEEDERVGRVISALVASPLRSDEVARLIGLDARGCMEFLGALVIEGRIEQLRDGRYAPTKEELHERTTFGHNRG